MGLRNSAEPAGCISRNPSLFPLFPGTKGPNDIKAPWSQRAQVRKHSRRARHKGVSSDQAYAASQADGADIMRNSHDFNIAAARIAQNSGGGNIVLGTVSASSEPRQPASDLTSPARFSPPSLWSLTLQLNSNLLQFPAIMGSMTFPFRGLRTSANLYRGNSAVHNPNQ